MYIVPIREWADAETVGLRLWLAGEAISEPVKIGPWIHTDDMRNAIDLLLLKYLYCHQSVTTCGNIQENTID